MAFWTTEEIMNLIIALAGIAVCMGFAIVLLHKVSVVMMIVVLVLLASGAGFMLRRHSVDR